MKLTKQQQKDEATKALFAKVNLAREALEAFRVTLVADEVHDANIKKINNQKEEV